MVTYEQSKRMCVQMDKGVIPEAIIKLLATRRLQAQNRLAAGRGAPQGASSMHELLQRSGTTFGTALGALAAHRHGQRGHSSTLAPFQSGAPGPQPSTSVLPSSVFPGSVGTDFSQLQPHSFAGHSSLLGTSEMLPDVALTLGQGTFGSGRSSVASSSGSVAVGRQAVQAPEASGGLSWTESSLSPHGSLHSAGSSSNLSSASWASGASENFRPSHPLASATLSTPSTTLNTPSATLNTPSATFSSPSTAYRIPSTTYDTSSRPYGATGFGSGPSKVPSTDVFLRTNPAESRRRSEIESILNYLSSDASKTSSSPTVHGSGSASMEFSGSQLQRNMDVGVEGNSGHSSFTGATLSPAVGFSQVSQQSVDMDQSLISVLRDVENCLADTTPDPSSSMHLAACTADILAPSGAQAGCSQAPSQPEEVPHWFSFLAALEHQSSSTVSSSAAQLPGSSHLPVFVQTIDSSDSSD